MNFLRRSVTRKLIYDVIHIQVTILLHCVPENIRQFPFGNWVHVEKLMFFVVFHFFLPRQAIVNRGLAVRNAL